MGFEPPGWDKEAGPFPVEAAPGLYLENSAERKLWYGVAVAKTIEQLLEAFSPQPSKLVFSNL